MGVMETKMETTTGEPHGNNMDNEMETGPGIP